VIQPTSYLPALVLLIVSMVCLGSWANAQKLAGKWRFELFYYDFAWGILIAAAVAAFTLGSFDSKELTFQDNLLLTSYRKMAWAVGSGVVFNLANLLLVAAIAVAGMAVAFPICMGLALIVGVAWSYSLDPGTGAALPFGGAAVVLIAVCAAALAYSNHLDDRRAAAQQAFLADPRSKHAPRRAGASKGILLSILAGLLMGAFYPILDEARSGGDNGVAPYGLMLLFAGGVFASTILYVPFFLNFPVTGKPLAISAYFRGAKKQHLLGAMGGVLWLAGGLSNLLASNSPQSLQLAPGLTYGLTQGATLVSMLWGLLAWREFRGATYRVVMMLIAAIVLFLVGIGMVALAPMRR
jgi:glucose uptake protein